METSQLIYLYFKNELQTIVHLYLAISFNKSLLFLWHLVGIIRWLSSISIHLFSMCMDVLMCMSWKHKKIKKRAKRNAIIFLDESVTKIRLRLQMMRTILFVTRLEKISLFTCSKNQKPSISFCLSLKIE
jgi:hypothetical protein